MSLPQTCMITNIKEVKELSSPSSFLASLGKRGTRLSCFLEREKIWFAWVPRLQADSLRNV